MLVFERYFENLFDDDRFIDARFINFLDDHLQRTKAQNDGGRHDALIATLQQVIAALRANQTTEDVARVRRIGKTYSLDALVALFKADVRQHEGTIKGLFTRESETYIEFFPQGLTEYDNLTRPETPTLVKRWQTLTAGHAASLPPAVVTLFSTYGTRYQTLREQQQTQQGMVDDAGQDGNDARTIAELAVVAGMHQIGALFPGQAARCASYYNQSLLLPQGQDQKTPPAPPAPPVG